MEIARMMMGGGKKNLINDCQISSPSGYEHYLVLPDGVTWGNIKSLIVVIAYDETNYLAGEAIRKNESTGKLEYFAANGWYEVDTSYQPSSQSTAIRFVGLDAYNAPSYAAFSGEIYKT